MIKFLRKLFSDTTPLAPSPETPSQISKQTVNPSEFVDSDEALLAELNLRREKMISSTENEFSAANHKQAADRKKIDRAEYLLKQSGISYGMAKFMTTVWLTKSDAQYASVEHPAPGKYGMTLTGGGDLENNGTWISFKYGKYHFKAENRPEHRSFMDQDSDYRYGAGRIFCNGDRVLEIKTYQSIYDEYFFWKYDSVQSLERGDWMLEIVDLFSRIDTDDGQLLSNFTAAAQKKRADGISD